jgi:hypothetical protein
MANTVDIAIPATIPTGNDKLIELCALADSLERQISRAEQIAERYEHEAHDTSVTAEQRAVATGQAEETRQIAQDLEVDLQRIDTALEALETDG